MARLRPGWLVAFCALVLAVSAWLPWLTTGQGRANAIGGKLGTIDVPPPGFGVGQLILLLAALLMVAAAMAARELSAKLASAAALSLSMIIAALIAWYFRLYVQAPVAVGYGMYVAAGMTVAAVVLSVMTMVVAWGRGT
ncbi:hypothetical protein [Mycolicibacterium bacteremicum]|uniref:Transmembrane protein n=1 Tax=Mycolicibacterium bacteremicum TaxID=564198 RepID=A0A1W9YYR7_MYCBA|nr:hypothetical protein [Mycolicibacterium bacteremicum]MCV7430649.1 hypothetical protein [Mycolicibacterium bacteremicum]ORA04900.1 hypothetical protein BST17_12225 [Mycolicibacterium bacteremicum]